MFIRSRFVTNSSSTSFIAYGMRLPTKYPMNNGKTMAGKWRGPLTWEDHFEDLTGFDSDEAPVRFDYTNEDDHAVIYAIGSRQETEKHYGYKPLNDCVRHHWDSELFKACEQLGIECERLPHWFIWSTGVDG